MKWKISICLAALLSATTAKAVVPDCNSGLPEMPLTAELENCSGTPCISAMLPDGQRMRLVLDTGEPRPLLSTKAAARLHITGSPLVGANGQMVPGVFTAVIPKITVGAGSLDTTTFVIADLSDSISKGTFPDVDGSLAYGAWVDRSVQLDYREHKLRYSAKLAEATLSQNGCSGTIRLITFGKHGPPVVVTDGFRLNEHPLSLQVDTMFAGSVLVYPPAAQRLGLAKPDLTEEARYFPFTDGGVHMQVVNGIQERFLNSLPVAVYEAYLAGPGVHLPDDMFDGTVGAELFGDHRVTMDFKNMRFWVQ